MIVFALLLLSITHAPKTSNEGLTELEIAESYKDMPRDTFHYGSVSHDILAAGHFHEHEMHNPALMRELMSKAEKPVATEGFDWTPVIFIPGMTGTKLEADIKDKPDNPLIICSENADWYLLYGGTNVFDLEVIAIMAPQTYKCTFDNLKLQYETTTGLLWPRDGVLTRVKGEHVEREDFDEDNPTAVIGSFDEDDPMASIGDFDADLHFGQPGTPLKDFLKSQGYTEFVDMWHAPYDFRKGPLDFNVKEWPRLKELIEHVYELNNQRKVALIGISMGGPYLSGFMIWSDAAWKEQYIESMITVSGVFGGAIYNLGTIMYGETYGIPYISSQLFQEMYATWGCATWLTPMEGAFDDRLLVKVNENDGSITEYKPTNLGDLFERLGLDYAADMKRNYYSPTGSKSKAWAQAFNDPSVKSHCLYNRNTPTLGTIEKDADNISTYDTDNVGQNTVTGGYTGDGVSAYEELAICRDWDDHEIFEYTDFPHGHELGNSKVIGHISAILKGNGESAIPCHLHVNVPTECVRSPKCPEGTWAEEPTACDGGWRCPLCKHRNCWREDNWLCESDQKCGEVKDECLSTTAPTNTNTETKTSGAPCVGGLNLGISECKRYAALVGKDFEFRMDMDNVAGCSETEVRWRGQTTVKVLFNKKKDHISTEACSETKKCVCFIGFTDVTSETQVSEKKEIEEAVAEIQMNTHAEARNFQMYFGIFALGVFFGVWQLNRTKPINDEPLLEAEI